MYTDVVTKTDACVFDIYVFTNKGNYGQCDHDSIKARINCLTINTRDIELCRSSHLPILV